MDNMTHVTAALLKLASQSFKLVFKYSGTVYEIRLSFCSLLCCDAFYGPLWLPIFYSSAFIHARNKRVIL